MKKYPILASILSLLIPGLGHMYAGQAGKGAMILFASIIIGSLNIIVLPLIAIANPTVSAATLSRQSVWAYWIPRVVHDILAVWSLAFIVWVIVDAFILTKKTNQRRGDQTDI